MPEGLLQFLNQIRDIWNNLPQQARIVVPIVGVVILGALIGFSLWSGTEEDQVIFSNLSDRDLRMVQGELASARIKYTVPTTGSIAVPYRETARAQMVLAMAGVPRPESGYQIFTQSSGFGDTFLDYSRKDQQKTEINIRNAIETLAPVQYATVQITPMVDSAFAVDKQPAKAVVILDLMSGQSLDYQQIEGVINIVALSVRGLSTENVQIVDDQGRTLSGEPERTAYDLKMEGAFRKLQYENQIATQRTERIRQSLAPLVGGVEYVRANVVVETDFNDQTTDETLYNPLDVESNLIPKQMEITIDETTSGPTSMSEAVVGVSSNTTATSETNTGTGSQIDVGKQSRELQYLVSERKSSKRTAPGSIIRLTATVLIDHKPDSTSTAVPPARTPWLQPELDQLKIFAQNAAGFDSTRNDNVELISLPFDTTTRSTATQEAKVGQRNRLFLDIAKYIAILAVALVMLFLMRSALEQLQLGGLSATAPAGITGMESDLPLGSPLTGAAMGEAPGLAAIPGQPGVAPVPGMAPAPGLPGVEQPPAGEEPLASIEMDVGGTEMQEIGRLQTEVMSFADQKPEVVAQIVEDWLTNPAYAGIEEESS
ncbi:MAG: flagellar basal-body MS-ring/collar protein FliF [Candidatus Poribacteria bacterium]|nr:flagellar basal-body MS-ring/collar protein FliF [Candidatus Poribacteria bacterium]MDP6746609.1 flagellar basal-body MS-ring/collar protein FliF [Candidatus Poribacteria bacterium]MDP6996941.1 flagellar basal-body MS-ring/collar protein FliF [Candidatus Poribacteria bacterium]